MTNPKVDPEWFRQYYGEEYSTSVRGLLSPERTRQEVDFILQSTDLPARAAVADLGCGEGRHALEFARRGHAVTAIDLNAAFLAKGMEAGRSDSLSIRWRRSDMRTPQPGPFNLVTLLFHSFGFFSDAENQNLLASWRLELAPGGRMVIDVWNRSRILDGFIPHTERAPGEGLTVIEDRDWDAAANRLRVRYTYCSSGGRVKVYDASFRLYSKTELEALLRGAGIRITGTFGSLTGGAWSPDTPRLVLVGQVGD